MFFLYILVVLAPIAYVQCFAFVGRDYRASVRMNAEC
jgi:hypothetical protein